MKIPDLNIMGLDVVAGVSIDFTDIREYELSYCLLRKKKGEVYLEENACNLSNINELNQLLPPKVPVVVNISGKVVLNKAYVRTEESGDNSQFMPVNQPDEFYHYEVEDENAVGVSICRRSIIDDLVTQMADLNCDVVDIHLGPYSAIGFWEYQLSDEKYIPVRTGGIEKSETGQFQFNADSESFNSSISVSGQDIKREIVLPYIGALQTILNLNIGAFIEDRPIGIVDGFRFKRFIDKTKFIVLGIAFLVLMLNFLSYESVRKKEVFVQEQLKMKSGIIAQRDSLENVLKTKENFIDYIGKNKTYYSYFLDEIAGSVPSKIILDEVQINPLTKKIQKREALSLDKKITISGTSRTSMLLNQWINKLEGLSWIDNVVVLNYSRNEEIRKGTFILEVGVRQ